MFLVLIPAKTRETVTSISGTTLNTTLGAVSFLKFGFVMKTDSSAYISLTPRKGRPHKTPSSNYISSIRRFLRYTREGSWPWCRQHKLRCAKFSVGGETKIAVSMLRESTNKPGCRWRRPSSTHLGCGARGLSLWRRRRSRGRWRQWSPCGNGLPGAIPTSCWAGGSGLCVCGLLGGRMLPGKTYGVGKLTLREGHRVHREAMGRVQGWRVWEKLNLLS